MYWFVIQYFGTMRIDRYCILWYDCRVCCVNIVEGAITMQYTDNEAALIGGLISNYFFQPSVDAKLRESYRRVLRHLHENALSASDLSRIQNALTFLSPLCRDTREAHKDMMGVTLKTDALLRASR